MTLHVGGPPQVTIRKGEASPVFVRKDVPYVPPWLLRALYGETAVIAGLLLFGSPL